MDTPSHPVQKVNKLIIISILCNIEGNLLENPPLLTVNSKSNQTNARVLKEYELG